MTVKEVIIDVLDRLDKKDLKEKLMAENSEFTDEENDFITKLISFFDLVQDEVATEYIPLIHKEKVRSEYGKFSLNSLEKTPVYVLSIKNENGEKIKYKICGKELLFLGNGEIEYCYSPNNAAIDGNVEILLPKRAIVYAVLREYYLAEELLQESSFYEDKFKNSLLIFSRKHGEIKMPARLWL